MKSTKPFIFWTLVIANVLLAGMLASRMNLINPAIAQQQTYRPAEYIMIPGDIENQDISVVYIIDQTNNKLGAIAYDDSKKEISRMPAIDLGRVFAPSR